MPDPWEDVDSVSRDTFYDTLKQAVGAAIRVLDLTGLADLKYQHFVGADDVMDKLFREGSDVNFPAVLLVTEEMSEKLLEEYSTTELQCYEFPVLCFLADKASTKDNDRAGSYFAWRMRILSRFDNREPRLSGLDFVRWSRVEPGSMIDAEEEELGTLVSTLTLYFQVWFVRNDLPLPSA